MKRFMFLSVLVAVIAFVAQAQSGARRYALIIGNAEYQNIKPLINPVNDATDIAAKLRQLGYQVELKLNAKNVDMGRAISDYIRRLASSNDNEGFFWYAGHGVELEGENYLLPVDVDTEDDTAVKYSSYPLNRLIESFDKSAHNKVNVVVIDACRENPFRNTGATGNRTFSRGLTVVEHLPQDLFIMYSTAAGDVAADGAQGKRNSPFAEAFLKHIATNEPFFAVASKITRETLTLTGQKQRPFQSGSIISDPYYSLNPAGVTPPQPAPAVTPPQIPRNVRAGTPGTDSVTLTWDSAGSGVSYRAYYNTQNNPSSAMAMSNLATGTSMNITGMESGTSYYFWVSTVKDGQESGKSPVVTVLTAAAVPVNPTPNVPSDMVRIQGGTFMMGSPASEASRESDEAPHQVTVSGFYLGKYEVTQKEYQALMGTNPSYFKGDNLPVEKVSWYDAVNYCNARSRSEGLTPAYTVSGTNVTWTRSANGYRLPTEAEWEYACRAGTTTPFSTGGNITTNQSNYNGNNPYNGNAKGTYREKTTAVGSFAANAWGLYDMHGNVWEWCWDWYGAYPSGAQTDPMGASSGALRVTRGGSWIVNGQYLRSAYRNSYYPSNSYSYLGFRLLRPSL
jgi:formylglycine-generating enzyme required for sulfatase activity